MGKPKDPGPGFGLVYSRSVSFGVFRSRARVL